MKESLSLNHKLHGLKSLHASGLWDLQIKYYLLSVQQNSMHEEGLQKTEVVTENVITVAKDPRYARYLKMVQVVSQFS